MLDNNQRVPFFSFEDVEQSQDLEKSEELGYAVPKLVTYIKILPHGHRDTMEFEAEPFIKRKRTEANAGIYSPDWVKAFETGFEAYKQGRELPRSGTPTLTWPKLLKRRREELAARFPTVEDIAAIPDSGLENLGLDGRILRDLAKKELKEQQGVGPLKEELAKAEETIATQAALLAKMEERLAALEKPVKTKKAAEVV